MHDGHCFNHNMGASWVVVTEDRRVFVFGGRKEGRLGRTGYALDAFSAALLNQETAQSDPREVEVGVFSARARNGRRCLTSCSRGRDASEGSTSLGSWQTGTQEIFLYCQTGPRLGVYMGQQTVRGTESSGFEAERGPRYLSILSESSTIGGWDGLTYLR